MRFNYAALGLVVACAPSAPPSPVTPAGAPEAAVYAALIDSVYTRPVPDTLLLGDSTVDFHAPRGGIPTWRTQFDSIPGALPPVLEAVSRSKRASATLPLSRPMRIVTEGERREIFARGIDAGWMEFYRRYPRQRNYLRFSPVAFSRDSLDAMVYYEYHCGGLCGGGDAVWLTRRDDQRWRVRKVVEFWVS